MKKTGVLAIAGLALAGLVWVVFGWQQSPAPAPQGRNSQRPSMLVTRLCANGLGSPRRLAMLTFGPCCTLVGTLKLATSVLTI
jgi:hypothetical protein